MEDPNDRDEAKQAAPSRALLRLGASLGVLAGATFFFYGLYLLFAGDQSLPFTFAMLIAGAVNACVSWLSVRKRSRVAWSFALSLNGVGAALFLFGASKVRDSLGVSIIVGLLPCAFLTLVTVFLALAADQFE